MSDTTDTAAPEATISRAAALGATRDGGQAARDGQAVTDCPYSAAGTDEQRFLGNFWIKGFNAATVGGTVK